MSAQTSLVKTGRHSRSLLLAAVMRLTVTIPLGGAALVSTAAVAFADEAAEVLLKKTEAVRQPRNSVQEMTMVVTNRKGATQTRSLRIKTRVEGADVSTLAEVTAPADVAGTRFLARDVGGQEPELYLYLPKLNRTSRMLAKRAALLGSDFAPAEMDFTAWSDATHTAAGHETLTLEGKEVNTDIIESVANHPDTADYARTRSWLGQVDGFPRKIEFMEADGTVVKEWVILEVATSDGLPYPKRSVMKTLAKQTQTELIMDSVRFNVPLDELPATQFTQEGLATQPAIAPAKAE